MKLLTQEIRKQLPPISVFFENSDEEFLELGEETTVFKIRESGNFSFSQKKWITSRRNSILIDE